MSKLNTEAGIIEGVGFYYTKIQQATPKFNPEDGNEYVFSQMSDDFDPHLDIAVEGGLVSKEQVYFYKIAKEGFDKEKYPQSKELDRLLSLDGGDKAAELKLISKERGKGKACNYSSQYGAGFATVARTAGVSESVGKKLVKAYKKPLASYY